MQKLTFLCDTRAFLTIFVYYSFFTICWFLILILLLDLISVSWTFLLFSLIFFSGSCLHSYFLTLKCLKTQFVCDVWACLSLFTFYSYFHTWAIHAFAKFWFFFSVSIDLIYILTIFRKIMQKITFLLQWSISHYFCLLFLFSYLMIFHRYTSVWSDFTFVNILIVLLGLFLLLFTSLLFTVIFLKTQFVCEVWAFLTLVVGFIIILHLPLFILLLNSCSFARCAVVLAYIL